LKFQIGGSGPDGRGLGRISGINHRRFDDAGEIYETDNPDEIRALNRCPYARKICGDVERPKGSNGINKSEYTEIRLSNRENLKCKKMGELIKLGHGLYRFGMTKDDLLEAIISAGRF
jgi:hypothetical protein